MKTLTKQSRDEYRTLFSSIEVSKSKRGEINFILGRINRDRVRYKIVAESTNIPWYFIAIIHQLEASGKFTPHLHNGDSLKNRTVQVPRSRPVTGIPPFTWEESAADALEYKKYTDLRSWSVSAMLYRLEKYNGFGYRRRNIPTPYLWSYCQHYSKGKFVKDGIYDPGAVSKQCGAAVLLKELEQTGEKIESEPEKRFKSLFQTKYNAAIFNTEAVVLQKLLNEFGFNLNPDGKAGKLTAAAYQQFTGMNL